MNIKLTITFVIAALSAISFISIGNQVFAQSSGNDQSIPFVVQNTSRSMQDPLPGHQGHQIVMAAPPLTNGKIYSGTATFTASVPVEVVVLHNYTPVNSTSSADNQKYGEPLNAPFGNGKVAISLMKQFTGLPLNAGSFDFAGTALAFHTLDGKPFTVTYTVDADIDQLTK